MRACAVGETNVELFAEEAKPQSVSICTALNFDATTLNLTIHQRYQRAKEKEDYANVILPFPKLLLGCKKRIKEYQVSLIDLCDSCVGFAIKWREISYQTVSKFIEINKLCLNNYLFCFFLRKPRTTCG